MTVEHPYGTIKSWMGATHFKMRTLKKVATEMALIPLQFSTETSGFPRRRPDRPHNTSEQSH